MIAGLNQLADWLTSFQINRVVRGSTGEYWKPIYNILENNLELLLVNTQQINLVPGRKTDVKDSEWITDLLRHGLLKASFIPPVCQRELRELTRHRANFVRERATLVNRVQKTLENANIKLGDVATNVMGVSGKARLDALVSGQAGPEDMTALSKGRLQEKRDQLAKALSGQRVRPHHRFVLSELLCQFNSLDETIARFNEEIIKHSRPFKQAVGFLDSIPGVARRTVEVIVSEFGTDTSRFATADHLASRADAATGNNENEAKQYSGKITNDNRALRVALGQAAYTASRTNTTYLSAQYHRLAARRGRKRAIVALAQSILVSAYQIIKNCVPYLDLGSDYYENRNPLASAKRLMKRLQIFCNDGSTVLIPIHSVSYFQDRNYTVG